MVSQTAFLLEETHHPRFLGYSVFAVTQANPSASLALPRTEADEIASTLPEPTRAPRTSLTTEKIPSPSSSTHISGFEDEDYELQAALQASLSGTSSFDDFPDTPPSSRPPPLTRAAYTALPPFSNPASGAQTPTFPHDPPPPPPVGRPSALLFPTPGPAVDDDEDEEVEPERDPVAASMARNRLMLQQMREEQEYAQRELWASGSEDPEVETRRAVRRRAEDEEAEQLRQAIEESEAIAREEGHYTERTSSGDHDGEHAHGQDGMSSSQFFSQDRVYDDDDAELQAALKASLEQVPNGWRFPEVGEHPPPRQPSSAPVQATAGSGTEVTGQDKEDAESVLSDGADLTASNASLSDAPVESVGMDELRRRRLAKFGA
jgi:ataxin-3